MARKKVNLEKIGVYIAAAMGFWTLFNSIIDIRERVKALEVKVDHLEKK